MGVISRECPSDWNNKIRGFRESAGLNKVLKCRTKRSAAHGGSVKHFKIKKSHWELGYNSATAGRSVKPCRDSQCLIINPEWLRMRIISARARARDRARGTRVTGILRAITIPAGRVRPPCRPARWIMNPRRRAPSAHAVAPAYRHTRMIHLCAN